MSDQDRRMECAEYVLGTLPADEREALERAMRTEALLRDEVVRWEDWLAGLNDVIPDVAPPNSVWPAIERRLRPGSTPDPATGSAQDPAPTSRPTFAPANVATGDIVAAFRRSRARWRVATAGFAALAAGLALFIASQTLRPPAPSYLAVVNRGGDLPALIVHVDTASDTISIRSLAAGTPPDRVLELWYIAAGQAPRSLGLLDRPETRASLPSAARSGDLAGSTLAVSVEPRGGSPTGAPTGQVVYSGKLIREQ